MVEKVSTNHKSGDDLRMTWPTFWQLGDKITDKLNMIQINKHQKIWRSEVCYQEWPWQSWTFFSNNNYSWKVLKKRHRLQQDSEDLPNIATRIPAFYSVAPAPAAPVGGQLGKSRGTATNTIQYWQVVGCVFGPCSSTFHPLSRENHWTLPSEPQFTIINHN